MSCAGSLLGLCAKNEAVGDKMLDVWFCQSMTSFLKLGPSKASQIMKLVSKALEVVPEVGSLHPSIRDLVGQPVRILRTTVLCLACLCRPIPGACGSSIDHVLEILGSSGKNVHLWQMAMKNLLEQPGGAWAGVVAEALRTASRTKALLPNYEVCLELAQKQECSAAELDRVMKDLPQLKEGMRQGALRKLEKHVLDRLLSFVATFLATPASSWAEQDLSSHRLSQLILYLGMMGDGKATEAIEKLRRLQVQEAAALASADLRILCQKALSSSSASDTEEVWEFEELVTCLDAVGPATVISEDEKINLQRLWTVVMAKLSEEARFFPCCLNMRLQCLPLLKYLRADFVRVRLLAMCLRVLVVVVRSFELRGIICFCSDLQRGLG